jgi:ferredoxin
VDVSRCNSCGTCYEACPSRLVPAQRRMVLAGRVYREGTPRALASELKHVGRVSRTGVAEQRGASHD